MLNFFAKNLLRSLGVQQRYLMHLHRDVARQNVSVNEALVHPNNESSHPNRPKEKLFPLLDGNEWHEYDFYVHPSVLDSR